MNQESNRTLQKTSQQKIDQKREVLLTQPVEKLVLKMAVPTIISMLVTAFYNAADTFFVGRIGTNSATGAVGIVFAFMAIVQAFGYFFGHGSGNYISRAIGRKQYDNAAKMAAVGFFSSVIAGFAVMAVGLLFRNRLAMLLGATPSLMEDTISYLTIILLGTPYIMTSFVLNNQLRLQGNSIFAMLGLVSGSLLNVILDPIFIFALDLGVSGAAIATIISQLIAFLVLFAGCQKSSNVSIRVQNFKPTKAAYREIAAGGLPSLSRQGLASIATLILNQMAGGYGDAAIAAFAVVSKLTNIFGCVVLGFGQGFQPVCGFNYGAGNYSRVKQAAGFSVKIATLFLAVVSVFLFHFSESAVLFFRSDPAVAAIGSVALRYQCFAFPLLGWVIIMNMFLQNIRKVVPASILAMARQGLVFVPVILLASHWFGLSGILWAQPISDMITFLIALPLGIRHLSHLDT